MHEGFRVSAVDVCQMSAATRDMLYIGVSQQLRRRSDWVGINRARQARSCSVYRRARAWLCLRPGGGGGNLRPRYSGKRLRIVERCASGIEGRIKGIVMSPASHVTWRLEILETTRRVSTSPKKLTKFRGIRIRKRTRWNENACSCRNSKWRLSPFREGLINLRWFLVKGEDTCKTSFCQDKSDR